MTNGRCEKLKKKTFTQRFIFFLCCSFICFFDIIYNCCRQQRKWNSWKPNFIYKIKANRNRFILRKFTALRTIFTKYCIFLGIFSFGCDSIIEVKREISDFVNSRRNPKQLCDANLTSISMTRFFSFHW